MSNPNTDVLAGKRCPNPKCGSYGPFLISAMVCVLADDIGTEVDEATAPEWEDSSPISCKACDHDGTVKDFKDPEVK